MKILQGFMSKGSYVNNNGQELSDFFELSPFAMTYSKTHGEYQHADHPDDVLHVFKSVELDTSVAFVLTPAMVKEAMGVIASVLYYSGQYVYPQSHEGYEEAVQARHSGMVTNIDFGPYYPGANMTLPEWVSWESLANSNLRVKIWLRTKAFESQYNFYEIVVVPPIDNLDDFFGTYGVLAAKLSALTISAVLDRAESYNEEIPQTYLRIFTFNYVNRNNPTQITPVNWPVLIYGKNGDNVDALKDAIMEYILAHSTRPLSDWELIFPDIFKRTEFLFLPRWDLVSIANLTSLASLYSSVQSPKDALETAANFWTTETTARIEDATHILPFDFKAISVISLNGATNKTGYEDLKTLFPDYIPVGTSSVDFNRMTVNTRNWVLKMVELLKVAETINENTTLSNTLRRVTRDGKLYVSAMYNEVNYMVAARSNVV